MVSPTSLQDITANLFEVYQSPAFRKYCLMEEQGHGMPGINYDSIGQGVPGLCLFTLQLYKHTGDKTILANLLQAMDALEKHRLTVKSNNYSLLGGRTGMAYLYFQYYIETGDEDFLEKAVHITRSYWRNEGGHLKIFSNHGLANGTAGILLFYLHLYNTIKAPWLLDPIEQHTTMLAGKAEMAGAGVYWNNANSDNRHSGWLNGSAGLAFCFLELGKHFSNPALITLAERTLAYEDAMLLKEAALPGIPQKVCRGNCKPGVCNAAHNNTAWGTELVRLYAHVQHGFSQYCNAFDSHLLWQPHSMESRTTQCMQVGIPDGWAGEGLAFREAWLLTGNSHYLEEANKIATALLGKLPGQPTTSNKHYNFGQGLAGVGYFLLKLAEPSPRPSILLPWYAISGSGNTPQPGAALPIDYQTINQRIIKNNFTDTSFLAETDFPEQYKQLLTAPAFITANNFCDWVNQLPIDTLSMEKAEWLLQAAEREMLIIDIRARAHCHPANDDLQYVQRVNSFLSLTDDELLQLCLEIASDMVILRQDKAIDYATPLEPAMLPVIFETHGSSSYYFRVNKFNDVEQGKLGLSRLYADLFQAPVTVDQAINTFLDFVLKQDQAVVDLVMAHLNTPDPASCRNKLAAMALHNIKELFMIGVLDIAPAGNLIHTKE